MAQSEKINRSSMAGWPGLSLRSPGVLFNTGAALCSAPATRRGSTLRWARTDSGIRGDHSKGERREDSRYFPSSCNNSSSASIPSGAMLNLRRLRRRTRGQCFKAKLSPRPGYELYGLTEEEIKIVEGAAVHKE